MMTTTVCREAAAPVPTLRPLWAGRAIVLVGIVLSALTLRTAVTSITPLLDPIGADLGFGSAVAGVFGMLPALAFAVFGLVTPVLVHRVGLERMALVAMLMAAVGTFTRSLVGDTLVLLALSALALGGMGVGNVVISAGQAVFSRSRWWSQHALHQLCAAGYGAACAGRRALGQRQ